MILRYLSIVDIQVLCHLCVFFLAFALSNLLQYHPPFSFSLLPLLRSTSLPPFRPQIKKQQQKIDMTLTSKNIEFNKVDVAASEDAKKKMREIAGNPTALPPQLCNGDQYCGVSSACVYTYI